ncbi:heme peroxidase [Panaeolus papilionaceus]|nr:heme peroxidase [Panaeolus papilionaceus]
MLGNTRQRCGPFHIQPLMMTLIKLLALGHLSTSLAYSWPSPQYDALEEVLYEGIGGSSGGFFVNVVEKCKHRTENPQKSTVAAEWLRFAYHDSATHNAFNKTGGVDASIIYELDRPENVGNGMALTRRDYQPFSTKYISKSDLIALGAVMAVAACGGPIIPFRGGRIDATGPGVFGVPEPHQSLEAHTESFRLQGFNRSEMIGLVACGHTLGGVTSADFPDIVTPPNSTASLPIVKTFDSTTAYDKKVVQEYLDSSTQNPLVVARNATLRSDLRIFSSDSNSTMRSMAAPEAFQEKCKGLLERMINSVPQHVTLSEPITPLDGKLKKARLLLKDDKLYLRAKFRLRHKEGSPSEGQGVRILWCDRYGSTPHCFDGNAKRGTSSARQPSATSPVSTQLQLNFHDHDFLVPIDPSKSVAAFWFQLDDGTKFDNDGKGYLFQDAVIYADSMSTATSSIVNNTIFWTYKVVAGVRSELAPSVVRLLAFDNTRLEGGSPFTATVQTPRDNSISPRSGFTFYSGSFGTDLLQTTIDLQAVVGDTTFSDDYRPAFPDFESQQLSPGSVDVIRI